MSFKRLDAEDFIISAESITAPAWSTNTPVLTANEMQYSTGQSNSSQGNYYLSIYQTNASNTDAEVQFDIAFGQKNGQGSAVFDTGESGYSPTSVVYGQFHNLVVGDEEQDFNFGGVTQSAFYAITVERNRYKEALLPGTFNLKLGSLDLTDNSNDISSLSFTEAGRVYQIVKGTNGSAVASSDTPADAVGAGMTSKGSYGLFLPDIGTIILNAKALDLTSGNGGIGLGTSYANSNVKNPLNKLYPKLTQGSFFQLNSEETLSSNYVFIRARNAEFNYSENPSFISSSQGVVIYDDFINNPQTFITTVGLYNDNNDLLATAKLSKALKKDFTKEALVRVKLDF